MGHKYTHRISESGEIVLFEKLGKHIYQSNKL